MTSIAESYLPSKADQSKTSASYREVRQKFVPSSSVSVLKTRAAFYSQELDEMYDECSCDNWDGYGASKLSMSALEEAKIFIARMPIWMSDPELVPEPNGDIGLQWDFGKDKILTISFSGDNTLVYAAILGSLKRKKYGSEIFNQAIPDEIYQYMGQIKK